ncbi:MAG: twin-arginine translocation signal domain-containing protein [Deltaproteobacteria bacterium]|nr:twin-arginine translocation signal domain-containing protein [Deltaproteobacteria bacterium]
MNRRSFLKSAGAVTVVAMAGGVWQACGKGDAGPEGGVAFEPWRNWQGTPEEGPLALVRAGILAASPLNTQPWIFHVTEDRIDVFLDTARLLPATDPFQRQAHMGLGCAVENMVEAGSPNGYRVQVTLPAAGDAAAGADKQAPVARLDLERVRPGLPVFLHLVSKRHTNRGPYDPARAISEEFPLSMKLGMETYPSMDLVYHLEPPARDRLGKGLLEVTEALLSEDEVLQEMIRWSRRDPAAANKSRDGVMQGAAGGSGGDAPEAVAEAARRAAKEQISSAACLGVLVSNNPYDRREAVAAGRLMQHFYLWSTSFGIAMQPLCQPITFLDRERARNDARPLPADLTSLLPPIGWQPMFAFRMGYALSPAGPSPRRGLEDVVKKGL